MYHYVYQLTSNRDKRKYIGVRSSESTPKEDIKYMSSSSEPKSYVLDCIKEILKEFASREEANNYEIRLHQLHNVAENPNFFNKANSTTTGFCTKGNREVAKKISVTQLGENNSMYGRRGKLAPMFGKHHSIESKALISQKAKGRIASTATKKKMAEKRANYLSTHLKLADVYCYETNELIAENIRLNNWAREHHISPQALRATATGTRKQHKGLYARYKDGKVSETPKTEIATNAFESWWKTTGSELSSTLNIKELCRIAWLL